MLFRKTVVFHYRENMGFDRKTVGFQVLTVPENLVLCPECQCCSFASRTGFWLTGWECRNFPKWPFLVVFQPKSAKIRHFHCFWCFSRRGPKIRHFHRFCQFCQFCWNPASQPVRKCALFRSSKPPGREITEKSSKYHFLVKSPKSSQNTTFWSKTELSDPRLAKTSCVLSSHKPE